MDYEEVALQLGISKGTVKDHREYHGLKETILTRVSFLEE